MTRISLLSRSPSKLTICGLLATASSACGDSGDDDDSSVIIDTPATPGTKFTTEGFLCDYSDVTLNSQPSLNYTSTSQWTCAESARELSANGIPYHEVGTFPNANNPNTISEQSVSASYTLAPASTTALGGPRALPDTCSMASRLMPMLLSGSACRIIDSAGNWSIEALGQTSFNFGTDDNNAHVQPGGSYHYHGMPEDVVSKQGGNSSTMTLIGWAADGLPIYARYGYSDADDAGSDIKVMTGSYQFVSPVSASKQSTEDYPLETFKQDWQYVEGSGDLDQCNGRVGATPEFPEGISHYYATDSYPYCQRCVKGSL